MQNSVPRSQNLRRIDFAPQKNRKAAVKVASKTVQASTRPVQAPKTQVAAPAAQKPAKVLRPITKSVQPTFNTSKSVPIFRPQYSDPLAAKAHAAKAAKPTKPTKPAKPIKATKTIFSRPAPKPRPILAPGNAYKGPVAKEGQPAQSYQSTQPSKSVKPTQLISEEPALGVIVDRQTITTTETTNNSQTTITATKETIKTTDSPDNNRFVLGGRSPFFLKTVNVEKRPLSGRVPAKNTYTPRTAPTPVPARPTMVMPSKRRSRFPMVILTIITILLGGTVGAFAYLLFFNSM